MFWRVSVPLRGLWFEIFNSVCLYPVQIAIVSVPLRGLWFEMRRRCRRAVPLTQRFRPLAGFVV